MEGAWGCAVQPATGLSASAGLIGTRCSLFQHNHLAADGQLHLGAACYPLETRGQFSTILLPPPPVGLHLVSPVWRQWQRPTIQRVCPGSSFPRSGMRLLLSLPVFSPSVQFGISSGFCMDWGEWCGLWYGEGFPHLMRAICTLASHIISLSSQAPNLAEQPSQVQWQYLTVAAATLAFTKNNPIPYLPTSVMPRW